VDYADEAAAVAAISSQFTHHPPFGDQAERYVTIREWGRETALAIIKMCPSSRERDTAIERLREAIMWANASIAVNEDPAAG
jgi:hypothetical protein